MACSAPRLVVALGPDASAEVVEDFGSPLTAGASFTNAVLEADLAQVLPSPLPSPPPPPIPLSPGAPQRSLRVPANTDLLSARRRSCSNPRDCQGAARAHRGP